MGKIGNLDQKVCEGKIQTCCDSRTIIAALTQNAIIPSRVTISFFFFFPIKIKSFRGFACVIMSGRARGREGVLWSDSTSGCGVGTVTQRCDRQE